MSLTLEVDPERTEKDSLTGSTTVLVSQNVRGEPVPVNEEVLFGEGLAESTLFSVIVEDPNTSQQLTVTGNLESGGFGPIDQDTSGDVALSVENRIDLFVYQQENDSEVATLVFREQSWDGLNLVIPELTGGARYFFTADLSEEGAANVSVFPEITVTTSSNELLDYTVDSEASISGITVTDPANPSNFFDDDQNINSNTFANGTAQILEVNGTAVNGNTPILGTYGTLEIDQDGDYQYTLSNTSGNDFKSNGGNYGDKDSFKITFVDTLGPSAQISEEFFNIGLDFPFPETQEVSSASGGGSLVFEEGSDAVVLDAIDDLQDLDGDLEANPTSPSVPSLKDVLEDEADDLSTFVSVNSDGNQNQVSIDPNDDTGTESDNPATSQSDILQQADDLDDDIISQLPI